MQQIRIGDVTIDSIIEREGPWRAPDFMFPDRDMALARRQLRELGPAVYDAERDLLLMTYQTFVLRTPHRTILVDTCTGEDKGFPAPLDFDKQPWRDGLHRLGLDFPDIDYVFCSHLHFDHCGWNTRLVDGRWVPSFPNAKYVFSRREYEFFEAATRRGEDPPGRVWTMNCEPIVQAGQALLVEDDFALDDDVWLTPTPGHSPCHCCVNIRSRGQRAAVTGDLIHHALQCREPDWSTSFCWDPAMAAQSRRKFLCEVTDTDTLVLPVHFPAPTAGHVQSDGSRFKYRFKFPG